MEKLNFAIVWSNLSIIHHPPAGTESLLGGFSFGSPPKSAFFWPETAAWIKHQMKLGSGCKMTNHGNLVGHSCGL